MRVTVLGTGIMGAAMARSLAGEGHEVTVWNRTPERAEEVAGGTITAAGSVAEAVEGAEAVLTVLFGLDSVLAVTEELVASLDDDAVWVQSSTIGPEGMLQVADAAGGARARLLDAPVMGTRKPAEEGALVVLASGAPSARERATPVLEAVGARTVGVGDELGAASALKLVANSWVATLNAGIAQAFAMADAFGIDPALFQQAVAGGPLHASYVDIKGDLMLRQAWETPSFAVDGVRKDVALMLEEAGARGVRADLLETLAGLYGAAAEAGHGGADMAAVRTAFDLA